MCRVCDEMLSEALTLVAAPSRIKVNYHILFQTDRTPPPSKRTHIDCEPHEHTDHQRKLRESLSYEDAIERLLVFIILIIRPRPPILFLFTLTTAAQYYNRVQSHTFRSWEKSNCSPRISAWIQCAWLALSHHNTSTETWNDRWVDRGVQWVWGSEPQKMIVCDGRCQTFQRREN